MPSSLKQNETTRKFTLDQFLKQMGWVDSGGQAKIAIQDGSVKVNGAVETRRRRQLSDGDVVEFETFTSKVEIRE